MPTSRVCENNFPTERLANWQFIWTLLWKNRLSYSGNSVAQFVFHFRRAGRDEKTEENKEWFMQQLNLFNHWTLKRHLTAVGDAADDRTGASMGISLILRYEPHCMEWVGWDLQHRVERTLEDKGKAARSCRWVCRNAPFLQLRSFYYQLTIPQLTQLSWCLVHLPPLKTLRALCPGWNHWGQLLLEGNSCAGLFFL